MHLRSVAIDRKTGGLAIASEVGAIVLHPLWLRERASGHLASGHSAFDRLSRQRLYEHAELASDLRVTAVAPKNNDISVLDFSDGERLELDWAATFNELGWLEPSDAIAKPEPWDGHLNSLPEVDWTSLDDPDALKALLSDYFKHGFCIFQNTPTHHDALKVLARRFGYLRETNFGELFNVQTKPDPSDLAYTDVALASHSDNPYRDPVPGIQFLHCLSNAVSGGLSTLVDGMAIALALRAEAPEQADVLERVSVRFRYEGPSAILEHNGPLIERDHDGIIRQIRLSSRLDYVPALDPETLSLFYAGRRRLHEMSNSPQFQISFPFRPGTLLMMDNYRLLHGRTAFNGAQGHRHLQGCYIDHDGPASLYRMLVRDGATTSVKRER